jgi:DNA-binding IclR family transcriptional regulator
VGDVSTALARELSIIDQLAGEGNGLSLTDGIRTSRARYRAGTGLSLKLASLGLQHLARNDIARPARPVLQRLAETSGELVRLRLAERSELVWVLAVHGARAGLREIGRPEGPTSLLRPPQGRLTIHIA